MASWSAPRSHGISGMARKAAVPCALTSIGIAVWTHVLPLALPDPFYPVKVLAGWNAALQTDEQSSKKNRVVRDL
jgi:hypothetical protein